MTSRSVLTFASETAALQDVRAFGHFVFTVASGSNTAQRIDLDADGGARVVGEANFGAGAGPYNILPLNETDAVVSNRGREHTGGGALDHPVILALSLLLAAGPRQHLGPKAFAGSAARGDPRPPRCPTSCSRSGRRTAWWE